MSASTDSATQSLKAWIRALERTASIAQDPAVTFPLVVDRLADQFDTAPALLSDGESLTFRALAERASRYSCWAIEHGVSVGDVVCLLMPNCPEYVAIWLGITRVGGVVALINTNLSGSSLAHSISIVAPKYLIASAELAQTVALASSRLPHGLKVWVHGAGDHAFPRIDLAIERERSGPLGDVGAAPTNTLRSGALHLHVRHDRVAQGCQGQPFSTDAMEPLVCRHDGHSLERPNVQLPADVSQHRRRRGHRSHAGQWRVRGAAAAIFGEPLLGRGRRVELHALPVYRRALPLPRKQPAASAGSGAPTQAVLRQWP